MGSRDRNGWGQLLCGRAFMAGNRMGIGFAWFGRNESLSNLFTSSGLNQPFRVALSEKQLPLKHMMGGQVSAGCGGGVPANHTCTCLPQRNSTFATSRLDTATSRRVHLKTSKQRHRQKPERYRRTGGRLGLECSAPWIRKATLLTSRRLTA